MTSGGFETIAQGDGSRIREARAVVARSDAEWRAVWAAHAGADTPHPPVDFDSRMVAAVFAGERPSAGFQVAISASRIDRRSLVLTVEHHRPAASTVAAQVLACPFHIISLPRHDGDVEFATANGGRSARPGARITDPRHRHDFAPSSTGLRPEAAGALAYVAGPFSGALLLALERSSRFVRFHAWQALIGLGVLGFAALLFLIVAFAMLLVSVTAFWALIWVAAITAGLWIVVWIVSIFQAYQGRLWRWPLVGNLAVKRAGTRVRPS